jgi:hypothetical protein
VTSQAVIQVVVAPRPLSALPLTLITVLLLLPLEMANRMIAELLRVMLKVVTQQQHSSSSSSSSIVKHAKPNSRVSTAASLLPSYADAV